MSNVINLGEYRFTRTNTRDPFTKPKDCQHKHITLNAHGEIVTCDDCGKQIGAFWALQEIVAGWDEWYRKLESARKDVADTASKQVVLRAALRVEQSWRSRTMVPTCPHCGVAILPTDGFGRSHINKERELARRHRQPPLGEG